MIVNRAEPRDKAWPLIENSVPLWMVQERARLDAAKAQLEQTEQDIEAQAAERERLKEEKRQAAEEASRLEKQSLTSALRRAHHDAEQLQLIRPEAHRIQAVSELVLHIQRISLLGIEGK